MFVLTIKITNLTSKACATLNDILKILKESHSSFKHNNETILQGVQMSFPSDAAMVAVWIVHFFVLNIRWLLSFILPFICIALMSFFLPVFLIALLSFFLPFFLIVSVWKIVFFILSWIVNYAIKWIHGTTLPVFSSCFFGWLSRQRCTWRSLQSNFWVFDTDLKKQTYASINKAMLWNL